MSIGGALHEIDSDLDAVQAVLTSELAADHGVGGAAKADTGLTLARLTLVGGLFGTYSRENLIKAAAAVEMLDRGVESHYRNARETLDGRPTGEALISGDFFYARAMILVLPLGCEVVRIGAEAIAAVAEGEVVAELGLNGGEAGDRLRKRAALYGAAFEVACHLSSVQRDLRGALHRFGEAVGARRMLESRLKAGPLAASLRGVFDGQAEEALTRLPSGAPKTALEACWGKPKEAHG